jgi:nucleoside-diphosphate-sugar epimerase
MPTAFVTGASGFIAGALTRRLVAEGWTVRALARSDASSATVAALGAEPVPGDLDAVSAMADGARDADVVFHAAAHLGEWGDEADFIHGNVVGTHNVLAAAKLGGARRFVHVGTEAALFDGRPLVDADETVPLRPDSKALYSRTKALAEQAVRSAADDRLETVVVRPRLVWGVGDTTILPGIAAAVEAGSFAWIGGGHHLTATTHVDNVVEGLLRGAERGRSGEAYFVTDGDPSEFRAFVSRLLETQGIAPPERSLPRPVGHAAAVLCETAWGLLPLPGAPPLTRLTYWLSSLECTIDITKARTELGYAPVTTVDEGMAALAAAHAAA